jgi:thiol-disulfide isomerase/thioredoxin
MGMGKIVKVKFSILLFISTIIFSQEYKIIQYGGSNKSMIVGTFTREALQDSNFSWWFNSEYTNYDVDTDFLNKSNHNFDGKIIKIVLGTWCSDSRREVPRIIKILDFIGFPPDKLLFIGVDRNKNGLYDEAEDLNIEYVPTIIVYESGKEIGRIIETPILTLEKDLIKIVD